MINVALIDTQFLYRKSLKLILEANDNSKVIYDSSYVADFMTVCLNIPFDVLILEFCIANRDVFNLVHKLSRYKPNVKVIINSETEYQQFLSAWMQYDLHGLITKEINGLELHKAIETVYHGGRYIQSTIAKHFVADYISKKNQNAFKCLSKRELQITWMIVCGLTVSEIAKLLYLSQKTITSYHRRIFDKLAIKNDVELIHTVLKKDYTSARCSSVLTEI